MNKTLKSLLILLFLTVVTLPKIASAAPLTITPCNDPNFPPFPAVVHMGEQVDGYYLLKVGAGKNIVFKNRLLPSVEQINEAGFCGATNVMSKGEECKIKLRLSAPNITGTLRPTVVACLAGIASACTKHELAIQIVDAPAPAPIVAVSVAVTPAAVNIAKGLTTQFTAVSTYSDGSTKNVTNEVTWISNNPGVAAINSAGLSNALAEGTAIITATLGAVASGEQTLTVTPPELVSIAVTPSSASIAKGLAQQFSATGTYTDASTKNLTNKVTWISGSPGIATINNAGLSAALAEGTTSITATLGTVISAPQTLTITPAELISIAVTPTNPSIAKGLSQQFNAEGTYTDTSTKIITDKVTWDSSDQNIAT
ncbi:MAG: Ig-like domain-containing protein, partial [Gammaproteobacteria bacterium]|nr:Ig-like domain-containing protein [Gammaproteobacteria bacterium]